MLSHHQNKMNGGLDYVSSFEKFFSLIITSSNFFAKKLLIKTFC